VKIAVNTRLLVPSKMDGIGRFTYETLLRILQEHPDIDFYLIFDRKINEVLFNFPSNAKYISLAPQARHPILWIIWFEYVLKNYLNKHSFDLFLSPEGWIPPNLKCKSLAVIHDLNFAHYPENILKSHRMFLNHYFPKYAERAKRIATVSNYTKQDLIKTYSLSDDKIDIVYNGANEVFKVAASEEIHRIKTNHGLYNHYFIFIGTIHPRKNLESLFKAFDQFKSKTQQNIDLVIVGNKKWWPESLEKTFQNLTHKKSIHFLGRIDDEELSILLSGAIALTYIPVFEGFGIPILEAFQCETAVITSKVTSMPEVAGGAALLCDPFKTGEIAEAMERLSSDASLRSNLINQGSERAKHFSWDKSSTLLWESMVKTMEANGS